MILTCHDCPRQLVFSGSNRERFAMLFGWLNRGGRFYCASCAEADAS